MRPINLIPAARIEQRRQRALLHWCAVTCVVYGVLALAGAVGCHVMWGSPNTQLALWLDEAAGTAERTERAITAVKLDLDATQQTLKASRAISEQPDWSIVLALLAARAGDDIVLRSCAIRQADPPPEAPSPAAKAGKPAPKRSLPAEPLEPSRSLTITGVGRPQLAVSQFALRLEQSQLFAKVRLVETSRTTLDRLEAVAFVIECSLDDPGVGRPGRADQPGSQLAGPASAPQTVPGGPVTFVHSPAPPPRPVSAAAPTEEAVPGVDDGRGPR